MHRAIRFVFPALWVCVAMICGAGSAHAQTAPDGNAHPVAEPIARGAAELPSAFGEAQPIGRSPGIADNHAFASQVDLAPLRSLAVWHDGRARRCSS